MIRKLKSKLKLTAPYLGAVLVLLIISGSAFYSGYTLGTKNPKNIVLENFINTENPQKLNTDFSVFWEAWDLLKKDHLKGAEAKDQDFLYGAIRGLVNSLNDPHTVFLPPEDSKKFEEDVNGSFGGIGAEIGLRNNQLIVVAPLKNTPAEKAGLRADDKILSINEKPTDGLDVNEAVKRIRGEIGTEVTLTVFRDNWSAPKDIKITRARIEIPTLESKIIDKEVAVKTGKDIVYLSLFSFNQNAPVIFYKEALKVLFGGTKGMILDLRNNPGGFLEVATDLAGWFLSKGDVIVTEKFRNGQEITFRSSGNGALKDLPVVILVNKGSASASEILAGALRAEKGIKLVGTRTFGKGTVQELHGLSDGSKIKLTIANWILPDGTLIDEKGLVPDYEVELTDDDIKNKKDPQLDKAIEILLGKIK